jgi:hypothetical protein
MLSHPQPYSNSAAGQDAVASRVLLPVGQLDSTKFKISQIMESILALSATIECGGQNVMPAWPDILAKYNVLLSQTHNLSLSLASTLSLHASQQQQGQLVGESTANAPVASTRPFSKLALHPTTGVPDVQFDNELIPLLRNQQTIEVLREESATVRRLQERLPPSVVTQQKERPNAPETHHAVIDACDSIRREHDSRCDRAMRAVALLRERYDWKARLAVEMEEPEEFIPNHGLEPDPNTGGTADDDDDDNEDDDEDNDNDEEGDVDRMVVDGNANGGGDEDSSADEAEMAERQLVPPSSSPSQI